MTKPEELTPKAMSLKILGRMKYGGCSPLDQTFFLKSIANIYVLIHGSYFLLSILNVILTPNLTVNTVMDETLMIVAYLQISAKYYLSSRQAKKIRQMVEMVFDEFWPIESGILTKAETENMRFLYRIAKISGSIYGFCAYAAVSLFASHALLKHSFIISIWFPNKDILFEHPYYEIMIVVQIFATYTACYFSVIPVDVLFIYFICFLYVQLKLLQKKFSLIVKNNLLEENYNILKECVEHHNRLIQFVEYLSSVYAKIFLPTIFTNFCMFTLTIYAMQAEDSINGKVKNLFIFICILIQLFAYCYGGQIIQDKGSEIGETIYNQKWYEFRDLKLKKGIIMVILRTSRPLQLTVAGFLILEMRSLAMVIRACFSFIAFLANVR